MWIVLRLLLSAFIGLFVWMSSEIPLIHREIAINTRKDAESEGPDYKLTQILSVLCKIAAVSIWIFGIVSVIVGLFWGGGHKGRFF